MIVEGYPLVVAMNALLYAIKSVSLVINDKITSRATTPPPTSPGTYDYNISLFLFCLCDDHYHLEFSFTDTV